MSTRTFTVEQLAELGLPHDLATPATADRYPHAAVELHRAQVGTRRWVSVHELVFRAPDDGKTYRVRYEQGLTEHQDCTDPWDYNSEVTAVEVRKYPVTVMEWRAAGEEPDPVTPDPATLRQFAARIEKMREEGDPGDWVSAGKAVEDIIDEAHTLAAQATPTPAADLTAWAEQLATDQLHPTEHQFSVHADDRPIVRVHFAFAADVPDDARTDFVVTVAEVAAVQAGADAITEEDA